VLLPGVHEYEDAHLARREERRALPADGQEGAVADRRADLRAAEGQRGGGSAMAARTARGATVERTVARYQGMTNCQSAPSVT